MKRKVRPKRPVVICARMDIRRNRLYRTLECRFCFKPANHKGSCRYEGR